MSKKGLPLSQSHRKAISLFERYFETHDTSQERRENISNWIRKYHAMDKMSQAHTGVIYHMVLRNIMKHIPDLEGHEKSQSLKTK